MKNRTARISMMKRTAGLILAPDDEGEAGDDEDIDSLWNAPQNGGVGEAKLVVDSSWNHPFVGFNAESKTSSNGYGQRTT